MNFFFVTTTWPADIRPHLTLFTLWVMTTATCLVVANIYYNQPLLADIAHTFEISDKKARQVSLFTQIGYATGLLFIIPVADMVKLKRLILIDFILVIMSLLISVVALAAHLINYKKTYGIKASVRLLNTDRTLFCPNYAVIIKKPKMFYLL
jgi:hypothetical protein